MANYIEKRSVPEPNSGCWLWLGSFDDDGYGKGWGDGKSEYAHRRSWKEHKGPILDDLWVLHRCDNPACVNPDHLFLGTHQDNVDDKMHKGRAAGQPPGELHWKAALTEDQVRMVEADPRRQSVIAAEYGIRQTAVSKIKLHQTWKHLWEKG